MNVRFILTILSAFLGFLACSRESNSSKTNDLINISGKKIPASFASCDLQENKLRVTFEFFRIDVVGFVDYKEIPETPHSSATLVPTSDGTNSNPKTQPTPVPPTFEGTYAVSKDVVPRRWVLGSDGFFQTQNSSKGSPFFEVQYKLPGSSKVQHGTSCLAPEIGISVHN